MVSAATAPPVEVAAAVILRPNGQFLLAQRPVGKLYAGWWEFPGGKIEPGEAPAKALSRELQEELGIAVTRAWPWIAREYVYPHGHVRLNFFRVLGWDGDPQSRESQALSWQRLNDITVKPLLPANGPILRALALPPILAITDVAKYGASASLERLGLALEQGLRLVMVREKQMTSEQRSDFTDEVLRRCRHAGALVLINSDEQLAHSSGADGLHLSSLQLLRITRRPDLPWCGASCHDEQELAHAAALGLDYVVLGPILATPSHSDARPLGWRRFEQLARGYPCPIYALGGMTLEHFDRACSAGAQGVAMIRGWSAAPDQSFPSDWSGSGSGVGMR